MSLSDAVFAKEQLSEYLITELMPAMIEHQKEIDGSQVDPNWAAYEALQGLDCLHIYTARIGGELVGYLAYLVHSHLHQSNLLVAMQDGLFIHPDHRRGRLAMRLIQFSEQGLAEHGVQVIMQCSTLQHNITPLYERLGYTPVEIYSMKRLRD